MNETNSKNRELTVTSTNTGTVLIEAPKKPALPEYAYTIKDKAFGEFPILSSANAWWMDRRKVEELVNAFKYDASMEEASTAIGIPRQTIQYFIERHPGFSAVIEACRQLPTLKARQTVVTQIATDGNLAFKYLERKRAEEFGTKEKAPLVIIPISMREVARDYKPIRDEVAGA